MKSAVIAALALVAPALQGTDAPSVTLRTVDGKQCNLAEISKEKVVLLVSWSMDCPSGKPCIGRADAIGEKLAGNDKVLYLGVSSYGDVADKLAAYAKEKGIRYGLCHDGDKSIARAIGARKVNSAFVFAKGKLFWSGGITARGDDPVLTAVEAALAGTPAPAANRFGG